MAKYLERNATSGQVAEVVPLVVSAGAADENEMEQFVVVCIPAAGSMKVTVNALSGTRLQGKHRVYYQIG